MRKKLYPKRFEIKISPNLHKESEAVATQEGLTLSQLIRDLLSAHVRMKQLTNGLK